MRTSPCPSEHYLALITKFGSEERSAALISMTGKSQCILVEGEYLGLFSVFAICSHLQISCVKIRFQIICIFDLTLRELAALLWPLYNLLRFLLVCLCSLWRETKDLYYAAGKL